MNWGLERSLGHVEMVEDRRILSTLAQRKKPNKQTWTTTWKRSVTFLPQAPMSLSCLHQNREGCSQCQGLCLRLFLGSGRTGLALPLGLPERVSQRLGCLAEVWVCADLAKGAAWALQCSKAWAGRCGRARDGREGLHAGASFRTSLRFRHGARVAGWQPYYSANRRPAQGARSLSFSTFMLWRGWGHTCTLLSPEKARPARLHNAPARPRLTHPASFLRPALLPSYIAARGSGGGCGLRAWLLWGRGSRTVWGLGLARGWENRRERRAVPGKGGAGEGRRVADSSLWKIRLTDTNPCRTRPPAPLLFGWEAPARTARPPSPGALSRPGRLRESFCRLEGPEAPRAFGKGRRTEKEAPAARARRVHGSRRLGCLSGGHRGGVGLSPAPSSRGFARNRPPGLPRGVPAPQPAMSRLLPLLRSRTAHSLRPGPAAAPRPPSWCCCGRGPLALAAPGGPRELGTHPKKEPMEALNTAQGARDFIYSLHSSERSCLLKELHRFESIAIAQGKGGARGRAGDGGAGAQSPPLPRLRPGRPAAPRPGPLAAGPLARLA